MRVGRSRVGPGRLVAATTAVRAARTLWAACVALAGLGVALAPW
jgi:hypothetical protein